MSLRRHTLYNLLGSTLPFITSLLTVPLYIKTIGEARYGVLAIVWLLLGYFGVFDMGLGRATTQRIASLHDQGEREQAKVFWSALRMNLILGTTGGLVIWLVASYLFGNVIKIDNLSPIEVQGAIGWLVLSLPVATVSSMMLGSLQAKHRFAELNIIAAGGTVLFQCLPLVVALKYGPDLRLVLPTVVLVRILSLVCLAACCWRYITRGQPLSFSREESRQLLGFGSWTMASSLISPLMAISDRFIISTLHGAKAVSHYSIPFLLAERSAIIPNALTSALFPRLAATSATEAQRLACNTLMAMAPALTVLIGTAILLIDPFLSWWIDPAFASHSALPGKILLVGFWAVSINKIPTILLQAMRRPDLITKCMLVELIPYFLFLYVLLSVFGVAGAAMAFCIRVMVELLLLAKFSGILSSLARLLLPSVIFLFSALAVSFTKIFHTHIGILLGGCYVLAACGWGWMKTTPYIKSRSTLQASHKN